MKKIRILFGCVTIIVIIVCVITYTGRVCSPAFVGDAFNTMNAFHDLPKDSVEVIVYGSSHAWQGVNVMEMYELYGIGAYNYACNWQHINTTSLFFKDSLRTQSPKVILIETYLINSVLEDVDMDGEIYYTRGISHFDAKSEYLKQCFGKKYSRYLSYYVPFVAFHSNWNNLSQWNFMNPTDNYDFSKAMGFFPKGAVVDIELPNPAEFEQKKLGKKSIQILDDIVEICEQNDIEIIFFTTPYEGTYAYSEAMKEYSDLNDCKYINLFEEIETIGIDSSSDFNDITHLNDNGAKKVAKFLGDYISSNYDVTDMRKVEGNKWERNLE